MKKLAKALISVSFTSGSNHMKTQKYLSWIWLVEISMKLKNLIETCLSHNPTVVIKFAILKQDKTEHFKIVRMALKQIPKLDLDNGLGNFSSY